MITDNVTTWAAHKRHLIAPDGRTRCLATALQPGDWSKHGRITRESIDALPLRKACAKTVRGADE